MSGVSESGLSQEHADLVESMLKQLLIVFVKRSGGKVDIPCSEIDDTSQDLLAFKVDPATHMFTFTTIKKN